ncbi:MAG: DUF1697 domain-containing protein [Hyphomicrobiaceae bacterium]|nr:DUF1697 domain-containing protein [Hyphomicrobiaceae bacterium]MCC0023951.1 DUF1697 domain-containing protein [Hyphomicrobiaceae bacterium]
MSVKKGTIWFAFLRGVNLGKRSVKNDDLKEAFRKMGFDDAQPVIASGNVLFSSETTPDPARIEQGLEAQFGFSVGIVLRSRDAIAELAGSRPFGAYEAGNDTKLYAYFVSGPIGNRLNGLEPVEGDFDVVRIDDDQFFTAMFRQPSGRFGSGLDGADKRFKDVVVTSRNWSTVERMLAKAERF